MPATAGRVRMPANNRVHSSAALQTHGIWQSAIGYDPYAPTAANNSSNSKPDPVSNSSSQQPEPDSDNAYASFQGLLALARITGSNADDTRGACKKCGRVGHLTYQCRNFLSIKEGEELDNEESATGKANAIFKKMKNGKEEVVSESSEEESDSTDSDEDSEMERLIKERYGGKKRGRSKNRSSGKRDKRDEISEDEERREKEKRRRRSHRRSRKDSDSKEESDDDVKYRKRSKKRSGGIERARMRERVRHAVVGRTRDVQGGRKVRIGGVMIRVLLSKSCLQNRTQYLPTFLFSCPFFSIFHPWPPFFPFPPRIIKGNKIKDID